MIGKSLVLLCALGIAAATCIQVPQCQYQLRTPVVAAQVVATPVEVVSAPVVQYSGNNLLSGGIISTGAGSVISTGAGSGISAGTGIVTDGPETAPLPVIQAPSVTLPAIQAPVVALPSQPIPAPRVIAQRCVCTKTVVKPQVIQRQVTVPKVQRYLKRTVTPVVENVSYKTRPVSSQVAYGSAISSGMGSTMGSGIGSGMGSAIVSGNCYSRVC